MNEETIERTSDLALTAWDLARLRKQLPDSERGQTMFLRTHQRLLDSFESAREIPPAHRSLLRCNEAAGASCLLIHGVSTPPGDLRLLADQLFAAGANVYVLRLPDFGHNEHTISEVSWAASLERARQSCRLLARGGGRLHVVGLGFGAALALLLTKTERLSSLVLLAPAIMPRESFFQRMVVRLRLHRLGAVHRWLGWNADLVEGMDQARGRLGQIRVPIFAAQCEDDDRASPASLRFLQRKARHKASRFRVFPTGGHAILAAHGEETLHAEITRFCELNG